MSQLFAEIRAEVVAHFPVIERVETVDADTGLSTGGSFPISNTTVVILDGQHKGSVAP